MWRHFALAFCCFTVAVTASERSPAKVRIHHERSTQAELIASVEALGKTHHLKLKRTLMPSVPMHEVRQDDNGTVSIVDISRNGARIFFEDEETGAFLFMNNENTLEGMVSDSVALHYDNNEHTASEVNEKTATPFYDVAHNRQMVDLPKDIGSGRLQTESKGGVSYVVEVLVVTDSNLTNYKQSDLEEYLRVYWKMVDRRFKTVIGASISIRLSHIISCADTACDSTIMDSSDEKFAKLGTSMTQFAKYLALASQQTEIPRFDVGHLMTRRNIFEMETNGIRNTTYTGGAFNVGCPCFVGSTYAYNSGISEDDGLWTGTLGTAQVIAQNLGAEHDGKGGSSSCASSQGYLMSNVRNSRRTFWFSPCSSAAMVDIYSKSYTGCLRTIDNPASYSYPNYIAGVFRSLDTQCQWATQVSTAIADPNVSANAQCYRLKCRYVSGGSVRRYTSDYPALDGTPCSPTGYCKDGFCQPSWV